MRLWSLHPKYLDAKGLVAVWREGLLAQAVLRGETVGYRRHPQLARFRAQSRPLDAISIFLQAVHLEGKTRGYRFDRSKIRRVRKTLQIPVSRGQVQHEWQHLMAKLRRRSSDSWRAHSKVKRPQLHPLFKRVPGPVESWETL
jgi:Pyrimidine dimer DNA glycosylase